MFDFLSKVLTLAVQAAFAIIVGCIAYAYLKLAKENSTANWTPASLMFWR